MSLKFIALFLFGFSIHCWIQGIFTFTALRVHYREFLTRTPMTSMPPCPVLNRKGVEISLPLWDAVMLYEKSI